ncbi:hypothetical protein NM688_g1685 [Phlebia brevispora]|uniref:Uncharacterized protein n=1 Tax=Phlebia brevispora TaxID=194682 RepID=A0ACC1TAQ0_9APHY|nr:hypothetical protein NM688_g1685 [Phlebia brevispora]
MDELPIDTSNPAVRDYLALTRLQVLTPLSLLINMATLIICMSIVHPGLGDIAKLYPTSISPLPSMIAVYLIAIYVFQIGYCVLLVLVRKEETKVRMKYFEATTHHNGSMQRTLIRGVGLPLVFANWILAGWAVAWLFQAFLLSTILLGILLVILVYANIVLLVYHAPTSSRPFDIVLIHAPMRAFMILPLGVLFPYSLFVTLGWSWSPGEPQHYGRHQWAGFGFVLGVNLLALLVVVLRRDIVLCVAASWICASIWSQTPKPFPVFITVVIFTAILPLALVASMLWVKFRGGREGAIFLPEDVNGDEDARQQNGHPRGPREVDAEALWG